MRNSDQSTPMKMILFSIIIFLVLVFMDGCKTNGGDIRPPLMNNDSFTNFVPMVITNSVNTNNIGG